MEPTSIKLDDVWLEYPIYGAGARSLRQTIVSMATAGRLSRPADGGSRVQALKGVSLEINEGDRIGLIGSNGAGKTSLLRMLAGAMWPSRGHVRRVGMTSVAVRRLSRHELRGERLGQHPPARLVPRPAASRKSAPTPTRSPPSAA